MGLRRSEGASRNADCLFRIENLNRLSDPRVTIHGFSDPRITIHGFSGVTPGHPSREGILVGVAWNTP